MNLSNLDASILAPALAAGLLVLLSHVPLGREVLRRGIIFIDLAVAQFAGLGVILAGTLGWELHGLSGQAIAFTSALVGVGLLDLLERYLARWQEALIGVTFVLAATGGMILLANNPHGAEHLKEMLVGQILWVEWTQLGLPCAIGLLVFALSLTAPRLLQGQPFYLLFALAITAAVQLVGVYLVFASLIIPALATAALGEARWRDLVSLALGALAYTLGLALSALFDLPSGPAIVWSLAGCGAVFALLYAAGRALGNSPRSSV